MCNPLGSAASLLREKMHSDLLVLRMYVAAGSYLSFAPFLRQLTASTRKAGEVQERDAEPRRATAGPHRPGVVVHDRGKGRSTHSIELDFKVSFAKCTQSSPCPASCPSLFNPRAQVALEHLVHEFVGYTGYVLYS